MTFNKLILATTFALSAALSTPVLACDDVPVSSPANELGILFAQPGFNRDLGCGEFEFASLNSHYGSSFVDRWKFTVAADSTASISLYDVEVDLGPLDYEEPYLKPRNKHSLPDFDASKVFDTQNLSFTLYDQNGTLLGQGEEGETLGGLNLLAGQWYTLKVSGDVAGLFGSAYHGALDTCVVPVPLGDSAPLLGSALAVLALRLRNRAGLRKA